MPPSLPLVLHSRDLPEAELHAERLDGDLRQLAGAFCGVDVPSSVALRGEAIAPAIPPGLIAERRTAAWVHGMSEQFPRPLQLCIRSTARVRVLESPEREVRQSVFADDDLERAGPVVVTTRLRTLVDLLRWEPWIDPALAVVIETLLLSDGCGEAECRARLGAVGSLPHKRRALARLAGMRELAGLRWRPA